MSDTTKKTPEVDLSPFSLTVNRNDTSLPFVGVKKKSKEGEPEVYFPAPDKKPFFGNVSNAVRFLGDDQAASILFSWFRKNCQGWAEEAIDEVTGLFSAEKFAKLVSDMSAAGESIPELVAEQMELVDALADMDLTDVEALTEAQKISTRIKAIKAAILGKRREKKAKTEEQTVVAKV